jgi:hypothetical protein
MANPSRYAVLDEGEVELEGDDMFEMPESTHSEESKSRQGTKREPSEEPVFQVSKATHKPVQCMNQGCAHMTNGVPCKAGDFTDVIFCKPHSEEAEGYVDGPGNDPVQVYRTLRELHWEFLRLWTGFELSSSCVDLP